jgi:hypothetical protein
MMTIARPDAAASGNDIGLGQLVLANGQRAELEHDQKHVGPWLGLR